jgi:hypothetical protein
LRFGVVADVDETRLPVVVEIEARMSVCPPVVDALEVRQIDTALEAIPVSDQAVAVVHAMHERPPDKRRDVPGRPELAPVVDADRAVHLDAQRDNHPLVDAGRLAHRAVSAARARRHAGVRMHKGDDSPHVFSARVVLPRHSQILFWFRGSVGARQIHVLAIHIHDEADALARVFRDRVFRDR